MLIIVLLINDKLITPSVSKYMSLLEKLQ